MTVTSATALATVAGDTRQGQIYTCAFGTGGTADSGASWVRSTNIGQKTYKLVYGTGGTAITDVPEGYVSGTTADIVVTVSVTMDGQTVNTYTVTVHRTYLVPQE